MAAIPKKSYSIESYLEDSDSDVEGVGCPEIEAWKSRQTVEESSPPDRKRKSLPPDRKSLKEKRMLLSGIRGPVPVFSFRP